jgi:L-threonylcarbamoyladenylate synthase
MRVIEEASLSDVDCLEILSFLRAGGVMGFPTDTAYGLGANPFDSAAVRRIFEIKGRREDKPILLLVDSMAMAESIAVLTTEARDLCARFWPGPLTVIVPARTHVPDSVTAGSGNIGLRWGRARFAQRMMKLAGFPLTATSANRSGEPAAVTAAEVRDQLGGLLELLIDGGELPARGGSTILDLTGARPRVVRTGPIGETELFGARV